MPTFICRHKCQHLGDVVKKGALVTATEDQLRLPAYAALLSPSSFSRLQDAPPLPPSDSPSSGLRPPSSVLQPSSFIPQPSPPTRAELILRLEALKVTPPKKATVAELLQLIADAADPEGAPKA